jgi:hypothetical protein
VKKKLYWLIEGHDSFKIFFKMKVGIGQFTSDQLDHLLKALAPKAGLSYSEIVGAYATRRTKIANDLLAVHSDYPMVMCGTNPYFTATVVDESGKTVPKPKLP